MAKIVPQTLLDKISMKKKKIKESVIDKIFIPEEKQYSKSTSVIKNYLVKIEDSKRRNTI